MTSIIDQEEAKVKALAELAEEDFKKAVAYAKAKIIARRQHFLPWKIVFRSPITLVEWADVPKNNKR